MLVFFPICTSCPAIKYSSDSSLMFPRTHSPLIPCNAIWLLCVFEYLSILVCYTSCSSIYGNSLSRYIFPTSFPSIQFNRYTLLIAASVNACPSNLFSHCPLNFCDNGVQNFSIFLSELFNFFN